MIDECTTFSMLAMVESKNAMDLGKAMKLWWFKIFQPPNVLVVDIFVWVNDDARQILENICRRQKTQTH